MTASRILLFSLLCFLMACGGSKKISETTEDFESFYDRFHTDMDFQLERIKFPLEGGSAQVDGTVPWTKENWVTMKVKIYDVDDSVYEVDYQKKEDEFFQSFQLSGTGFAAEYRFKKIAGKWYLVYALDSNL